MTTVTTEPLDAQALLTEELLRTFDTPGPRYTSYPTADRFAADFGAADAIRVLTERRSASTPLSLYVHIPFCQSLCYYCGCNKIITKNQNARRSTSTRSRPRSRRWRIARPRPAGRAAALRRRHADLSLRAELTRLMHRSARPSG